MATKKKAASKKKPASKKTEEQNPVTNQATATPPQEEKKEEANVKAFAKPQTVKRFPYPTFKKPGIDFAKLPKSSAPVEPGTKGVVILALGDPQYGRMAANAAASIRFADSVIPIHLVYSDRSISHLTDAHKALFTSMAECPDELMTKNGKRNYFKPKACIYELSPFQETLLIDADLVLFGGKNVSSLMQQLSAVDFTMQSRGWFDYATGVTEGNYTHWCEPAEAKEAYNLTGKLYQLSSELVYFKKTTATKKLFDLVREIFEAPKVACAVTFSGDLPDELAYNLATAMLEMYPAEDKKVFIYWDYLDKKMPWTEVISGYYGYSAGGNNMLPQAIHRYEQMAKAHANALRLPYPFKLYPKKQWDKSRAAL